LKIDVKGAAKQIVRGISSVLAVAGALILFFGGKALHEFYSVSLVSAELAGIAFGAALMVAAAVLKLAIGDQLQVRRPQKNRSRR